MQNGSHIDTVLLGHLVCPFHRIPCKCRTRAMAADVWKSVRNMEPLGLLRYTGKDHACATAHGQCYWKDIEIAKEKCRLWEECKYIWQTYKHAPATFGKPVYWARRDGNLRQSVGDVVWTSEGNIILNGLRITKPCIFSLVINHSLCNECCVLLSYSKLHKDAIGDCMQRRLVADYNEE